MSRCAAAVVATLVLAGCVDPGGRAQSARDTGVADGSESTDADPTDTTPSLDTLVSDPVDAPSDVDEGDGAGEAPDAQDLDAVDLDAEADATPSPWRSVLYPVDWQADAVDVAGDFLHDFSYAGYHGGEEPPDAATLGPVFDVTAYGAVGDGSADATGAFQAAIDAAAAADGGVVLVPAGLFRVDGALTVRASGVVMRGEGSARSRMVFPARAPGSRSHVLFAGAPASDLEIPLAVDGVVAADVVEVVDAGGLAVGDDIVVGWTITPEFVADHGMTGTWGPFNDTWQPFFRREVVAIDREVTPHRVTLDVPLRYSARVRDGASLRRVHGLMTECGFEGIGVANAIAWDDAWAEDQVAVLEMRDAADCWVRDVVSFPSPAAPTEGPGAGAHLRSSGIRLQGVKRVTVADCSLAEAQNRGGGGNGYLFEIRTSNEVLTRDSTGRAGRHNFIQNWGFGTTGCVWLRVRSSEGRTLTDGADTLVTRGLSEFHHSLATANLIDSSQMDDGWGAENRGNWSSGAGHSAAQNVAWNTTGAGVLRWYNHGRGYVVGTSPGLTVATRILLPSSLGTEPEDFVEGLGVGAWLEPRSLYEDQRARRVAE